MQRPFESDNAGTLAACLLVLAAACLALVAAIQTRLLAIPPGQPILALFLVGNVPQAVFLLTAAGNPNSALNVRAKTVVGTALALFALAFAVAGSLLLSARP